MEGIENGESLFYFHARHCTAKIPFNKFSQTVRQIRHSMPLTDNRSEMPYRKVVRVAAHTHTNDERWENDQCDCGDNEREIDSKCLCNIGHVYMPTASASARLRKTHWERLRRCKRECNVMSFGQFSHGPPSNRMRSAAVWSMHNKWPNKISIISNIDGNVTRSMTCKWEFFVLLFLFPSPFCILRVRH